MRSSDGGVTFTTDAIVEGGGMLTERTPIAIADGGFLFVAPRCIYGSGNVLCTRAHVRAAGSKGISELTLPDKEHHVAFASSAAGLFSIGGTEGSEASLYRWRTDGSPPEKGAQLGGIVDIAQDPPVLAETV